MSELGWDVIAAPWHRAKRAVCRLRGHRWQDWATDDIYLVCLRCGQLEKRPGTGWAAPDADPLGDLRRAAQHLTGPQRVRAKLREQGLAATGGDSPEWRLAEPCVDLGERVRWAEQRPAEARALVRPPDDRLWLLGEDGRVNRRVESEELESWAEYEEPQATVDAETGFELRLPARYVGIPFSISRVTWAEFARLGGPPPGPPNPPRPPHDRPYA